MKVGLKMMVRCLNDERQKTKEIFPKKMKSLIFTFTVLVKELLA